VLTYLIEQRHRMVPWDECWRWTDALLTLATEQGSLHWLVLGLIYSGWALAAQGQVEEGIARIQQGLACDPQ
jgi:hypothetical protein